jgi:hypothetical protein
MAHRREDVSMLEVIRQMDARIKRLETQDKGVRQNDIRIGNQLIREGEDDNTLSVTDLRDGSQFILPGGDDEETIYNDMISLTQPHNLSNTISFFSSPTWVAPFNLEFVDMTFSWNTDYCDISIPGTFSSIAYYSNPPYDVAGHYPYGNSFATNFFLNYTSIDQQIIVQRLSRTEPGGWSPANTGPDQFTARYLRKDAVLYFDTYLSSVLSGTGPKNGGIQIRYRAIDFTPPLTEP